MLANSFKLKGYTFGKDPSHIMLATKLLKADEGCAKSQNTYFDAFAQIFLDIEYLWRHVWVFAFKLYNERKGN